MCSDIIRALFQKVLRSYPQTAIILMGSFMTLVFGVLNLVVAVVVDTFADARCAKPIPRSIVF